jgi:hypothetical protein
MQIMKLNLTALENEGQEDPQGRAPMVPPAASSKGCHEPVAELDSPQQAQEPDRSTSAPAASTLQADSPLVDAAEVEATGSVQLAKGTDQVISVRKLARRFSDLSKSLVEPQPSRAPRPAPSKVSEAIRAMSLSPRNAAAEGSFPFEDQGGRFRAEGCKSTLPAPPGDPDPSQSPSVVRQAGTKVGAGNAMRVAGAGHVLVLMK